MAFSRRVAVVVKMDPITEELERGPNGLCIPVHVDAITLIQSSIKTGGASYCF
jgi:hypothetical protein